MTSRPRHGLAALAILLACSLAGCASLNEKASAAMGDYVPQWAGGLPADAPPRPGTAKYDEWMKERERLRQLPADQRPVDPQAAATPTKPLFSSSLPGNAKPAAGGAGSASGASPSPAPDAAH